MKNSQGVRFRSNSWDMHTSYWWSSSAHLRITHTLVLAHKFIWIYRSLQLFMNSNSLNLESNNGAVCMYIYVCMCVYLLPITLCAGSALCESSWWRFVFLQQSIIDHPLAFFYAAPWRHIRTMLFVSGGSDLMLSLAYSGCLVFPAYSGGRTCRRNFKWISEMRGTSTNIIGFAEEIILWTLISDVKKIVWISLLATLHWSSSENTFIPFQATSRSGASFHLRLWPSLLEMWNGDEHSTREERTSLVLAHELTINNNVSVTEHLNIKLHSRRKMDESDQQ